MIKGDKMIVELNTCTNTLLQKVKTEFGQSLPDEEIIKDALKCYYIELVQINRQKSKYTGSNKKEGE